MHRTKLLLTAMAVAIACPASAQTAQRFDLLITEIMADPTPAVGLPNAEFIEIRNVSATTHNLQGWRLSDAAGTATITTSLFLQPDSALILCANSNVTQFAPFGRTIGVPSFPSLDNDGEMLVLRSPQNRVIHAVPYKSSWYNNAVKQEGGWSLEMIDQSNPCSGNTNWKASTHSTGGTPGKTNSVAAANADDAPPQLKKAFTTNNTIMELVFDEPLDSLSASVAANYSLPGNNVLSARPLAPLFQQVQLQLQSPMSLQQVHTVTVTNLTDCRGNTIGVFNKTRIGLPEPAGTNDIVINEILSDPRTGGYDYVEFYNRSKKIIDAATLYIGNRTSSGATASLKRLAQEPFFLFPGDFVVVTEDAASLAKNYLLKNSNAVLALSSLPSFPDKEGNVLLLNATGDIVDEVAYGKDWHFALISDSEGVSLERIDPEARAQNKNNWHSAAATAGYGTPGYQNSQYRLTENMEAAITISPVVFSPDGDGFDDIATIHYQLSDAGYVANVAIFTAGGRLVRYLVKNDLLALKGFWKWDGLGEQQNRLPMGNYIISTEIFNLEGKKKSFKNTIVLAKKLN